MTLLGQGVGLGDPQRALPTPTMLGFCDSVSTVCYSDKELAKYNSANNHRNIWDVSRIPLCSELGSSLSHPAEEVKASEQT